METEIPVKESGLSLRLSIRQKIWYDRGVNQKPAASFSEAVSRKKERVMKQTIDMRGVACPGPVVAVKKKTDDMIAGELLVLVDNQAAVQNLEKFAEYKGFSTSWEKSGDKEYAVQILVGQKALRDVDSYFDIYDRKQEEVVRGLPEEKQKKVRPQDKRRGPVREAEEVEEELLEEMERLKQEERPEAGDGPKTEDDWDAGCDTCDLSDAGAVLGRLLGTDGPAPERAEAPESHPAAPGPEHPEPPRPGHPEPNPAEPGPERPEPPRPEHPEPHSAAPGPEHPEPPRLEHPESHPAAPGPKHPLPHPEHPAPHPDPVPRPEPVRAPLSAVRPAPAGPMARGTILVISSDSMGEGDEALGRLLMKGFLYAMVEQERLPEKILFYNSGVFLITEGSGVLEDLQEMERRGVRILTCGTCLNHFNLLDRLQVGEVTNMYEIAQCMMQAERIIKP